MVASTSALRSPVEGNASIVARTVEPHAPDVSQGSVAPDLQPPVAGAVAGGVPGSSSDAPVGAAQQPETSGRGSQTLRDPLAEALRLIELGDRRGIEIRLMGGLAFHALVTSWTARIDRDGRDMDLATRSRDRKAVQQLLAEERYVPDRQYNALYGHKQLYFVDPEWN